MFDALCILKTKCKSNPHFMFYTLPFCIMKRIYESKMISVYYDQFLKETDIIDISVFSV